MLSSLNDKSVLKGTTITLNFGKESVTGSAGCNFFNGGYKISDAGSLKIKSIGVTRMFCGKPAGVMQQEREYLNLLQNVKKYTIKKNNLILKTNDNRELVFDKMSHAIKGTKWVLNSLNDKSVLKDTNITLTFDNESVMGSAGCNFYSGGYKASDAGFLTIQSIISTLMYCTKPEIMQQESEYLNLLQNVKEYTIQRNNLILKTSDGRELVFKKNGTVKISTSGCGN